MADEIAWLVEWVAVGGPLYVHKDFDGRRYFREADSIDSHPYEWIGGENGHGGSWMSLRRRVAKEKLYTHDASEAMRFPTKAAAEKWRQQQMPIFRGDIFEAREHMWLAAA